MNIRLLAYDYSGHSEIHRKLSLYMEAAQMRAALPIQSFSTGIHARAGSWFSRMANATAAWTGKPVAFLLAFATIVIWAVTGPLFHYSDTWQLVINTGTTIITLSYGIPHPKYPKQRHPCSSGEAF